MVPCSCHALAVLLPCSCHAFAWGGFWRGGSGGLDKTPNQ
jgi:hypothetical protein